MTERHPIATAPKDRSILLWGSNARSWVIGWWETGREFRDAPHFNDWSSGDAPGPSGYDCGFQRVHNPTWWAELPDDPDEREVFAA